MFFPVSKQSFMLVKIGVLVGKQEGDFMVLAREAAIVIFFVCVALALEWKGRPDQQACGHERRLLLAIGDMDQVCELLGHHYESESVVERGQQLGRTMGFPTFKSVVETGAATLRLGFMW